MRVPFPFPFTLGTDIVLRSRITRLSGPLKLEQFAARILHPLEVTELSRRFPDWRDDQRPSISKLNHISSFLAGRWAAKEAAKKAWGASLLSFTDLRVEASKDSGEVQVICGIDDPKSRDLVEQAAKLSISHDGDYAVAVVIATPLHQTIKSELGRRKTEAESAWKV